MGTEVAISFSNLRAQLENEKSSLYKLDENIKKIVQTSGRFSNDRFNASGDYSRGGNRLASRNSYPDAGKNEDAFGKRKHETKTVFSRLSARSHDSDGEDDGSGIKRTRVSSAVSRELPSRAAVLRAQGGDEQARTRNRRMFGSLLGTLQKFKQEEIGLQNKEEKRAQVERKIEEQARLEKEREQTERKTLFREREQKKAAIKVLETKMWRVQEFERWEASQKNLGNFILTKVKPHIFWIPKKMCQKTEEKLASHRKEHEKYMARKREELQEELLRIEHRCLRTRPEAKENEPNHHEAGDHEPNTAEPHEGEGEGKKRDKFVTDGEKMEDSDAEDGHDEAEIKKEQQHVSEENMDTSVVENTASEDMNGSQNPETMETETEQPEPSTETTEGIDNNEISAAAEEEEKHS